MSTQGRPEEVSGPAFHESTKTGPGHTRASALWTMVVIAVVVLVFLLVFILQNSASTSIYFLGMQGDLPLGMAMLFAALAGALLIALAGTARILQLRSVVRKRAHRHK